MPSCRSPTTVISYDRVVTRILIKKKFAILIKGIGIESEISMQTS